MIAGTNKVHDILRAAARKLQPLYDNREALSIAERLVDERFGMSRLKLALNPDALLTESEIVQVHKDLQKLLMGVPIQYVTGTAWFLDLKLKVNSGVLIPRPETEEMVMLTELMLSDIPEPRIWDAGTGSGAIAIALKHRMPSALVYASDISSEALEVAKHNASVYQIDIEFFESDILSPEYPVAPGIDCLISNPPYIPDSEASSLSKHVVTSEPHSALFVPDADPLLFYRALGIAGVTILKPDGLLMCETHHRFASDVAKLYKGYHYQDVKVISDMFGKERFVSARKPQR